MSSPFLHIQKSSEPCKDFPTDPAQIYSFPLDPFQQKAIAAISSGANVLVTAKTGSGKTLVGESSIRLPSNPSAIRNSTTSRNSFLVA